MDVIQKEILNEWDNSQQQSQQQQQNHQQKQKQGQQSNLQKNNSQTFKKSNLMLINGYLSDEKLNQEEVLLVHAINSVTTLLTNTRMQKPQDVDIVTVI